MFGYDYLHSLLYPFVARLVSNDRNFATSYEVDPARYHYFNNFNELIILLYIKK